MIISSLNVRSRKAITRRRSTTPQYCGHNDALPSQSRLQCHSSVSFRIGYFLKSYLYFRKSNGSFSWKLPFFRELLIPAAKIQIISENLVQLSENRTTLTILSINQCTILLKMAFFSIFQCLKIWLYPIFVLLLHPKTNDMRYR